LKLDNYWISAAQDEVGDKDEIFAFGHRQDAEVSDDFGYHDLQLEQRKLLPDAVAHSGTEREVAEVVSFLDCFRQKSVRIKFLRLWKLLGIAMNVVDVNVSRIFFLEHESICKFQAKA